MADVNRSDDEVFGEALELPVAERTAFLARACAGDAAQRARVEALLAGYVRSEVFLEQAAIVRPGLLNEEKEGDQLGNYTLVRKLGEGGYGTVYLAEQSHPVRRQVALKIIKLGMDTRQVIARFEVERQALAMMDHPDIARVFDAGATAGGRPYFVMEFVDGPPITKFADAHRLSIRARLELFSRVCHAVQHAHQKGIIHRDLKPSNVLVTLVDGKPAPKVIDFGIAKATEERLTDATALTAAEQYIGTPAYMSPEQIGLGVTGIDTRSDVYSLGVLLYELLTGQTPFEPRELLKIGYAEIRRHICEVDPPAPSTRVKTLAAETLDTTAGNRQLVPPKLLVALRGDLDWIVLRCLEKEPGRRYATANGLARDLARYLADEPVEARPVSSAYRLRKLVRRHRLAVGAAAAVLVAVLAGAGVATWQAIRASRAERAARQDALTAKTVSDFLTKDLLAQADTVTQADTRQPAKADLQVREALDRAAARVGERFADQPIAEAAIRSAIGQAYVAISLPKAGVEHLERAVTLYARVLGPEHTDTLFVQYNLAEALHSAGRAQESIDLFQKTLKTDEAVNGPDTKRLIEARHNLGTTLSDAGRHAEAKAMQMQNLLEKRRRYGSDHPQTLLAANNLSMTLDLLGKHAAAERLLRDTTARFEKTLGPEHPQTVLALNNLALTLLHLGRPAEAAPVFERILPLLRKIRGPEHEATAAAINNLALAYRDLGNASGFATYAEQALVIFRKAFGPDHQNTLIGMMNLGLAHDMNGRPDEAERVTLEAIERLKRALGPEHFLTLIAIGNLGAYYAKQDRWEQAIAVTRESVEGERRVLGAEHRFTVAAVGNLAQRYSEAGLHDQALPLHQQAVGAHVKLYGADRPPTLGRQAAQAVGLAAAGRTEEAIKLFAATLPLLQDKAGPDHPTTAKTQVEYAAVLAQAGRNAEAAPLAGAALAAQRKVLGAEHPATIRTQQLYADMLTAIGRGAEAEPLLRAVLAVREKTAAEHWSVFDARSSLGAALLTLDRAAEAEPLLLAGAGRLWENENKIPPVNRDRVLIAVERVIRFYQATNRLADAAAWRAKLAGRTPPTPAAAPASK